MTKKLRKKQVSTKTLYWLLWKRSWVQLKNRYQTKKMFTSEVSVVSSLRKELRRQLAIYQKIPQSLFRNTIFRYLNLQRLLPYQ